MAEGSDDLEGFQSLRSVLDGAVLHYLGTAIVNLIEFLLTLLLTRVLGASVYGIYAFGTMLVGSVLAIANLGTDIATMRYLAASQDDRPFQNRTLGLAYATTLLVGALVGAVLFVLAPTITAYTLEEPVLTPAIQVFAIAVPFQALTLVAASTVRGLELPVEKTVILVVEPALKLAAIGMAVFAGYALLGVVAAYAVACVMAFLFALAYSLRRTGLRPRLEMRAAEMGTFYRYSAPLSLSKASTFLFKRVDVLMVGIFLAAADVGIYNVAVILAGVIALPLAGINQLFPPAVSRLSADGDEESLASVYATVTRWSITASILVALPIVVYRLEVLALFGPEFVAGWTVLVLFVAAQLCNAAAGPANDVLMMTDHQYVVLGNHLVLGLANVVLNYILIVSVGLIGAAIATATTLAVLNVLRVLEVWYLEGLFAYSRRLWKPLVAGGVAGLLMVGTGHYLEGIVVLFVGGSLGACGYLLALYLLGIEQRDREFATAYVGGISD